MKSSLNKREGHMSPRQKPKNPVDNVKEQLVEMTTAFCIERLDDEYAHLCAKMIEKMAKKRPPPFLSGDQVIWAAAIVYAIGNANFLFDKSFTPYATPDDITKYFNVSKSTIRQKAAKIKVMFKLDYGNEEFSTKRISDKNPFKDYVKINGYLMPLSEAKAIFNL